MEGTLAKLTPGIIGLLGAAGPAIWAFYLTRTARNDKLQDEDRTERKEMQKQIDKLRNDMDDVRVQSLQKDSLIEKQRVEIDRLTRELSELLTKIRAFLHKLTDVEGIKEIQADVDELEREFIKEKK